MGVRIPPGLPFGHADGSAGGAVEGWLPGADGRERGGGGRWPFPTHAMDFLKKAREFFHDVLVEFRRVSWPSRREVTGSTTVVIVVVMVLAVFLAVVDVGLSRLVGLMLR